MRTKLQSAPWAVVLGAVAVVASLSGGTPVQGQQPGVDRLSAEFIPAGAMVSGFAFVQEILAAPELKLMPIEVARAWTVQNIGVDLADIESLTVVVGVPGPQGVDYGVVVKLSADFDLAGLNPNLVAGPAESIGGLESVPLFEVTGPYAHQINPRTVLVATSGYLAEMLAAKEPRGPLGTFVARLPRISPVMVAAVMEPIRPQINQAASQVAGQLPPPVRDLLEVPDLIEGVVVAAGISMNEKIRLMLLATDEEAATEVEAILNNAIQFGRDLAVVQATQGIQEAGPIPDAVRAYFKRVADEVATIVKPTRTGRRLMIEVENERMVTSGMMAGLALPILNIADNVNFAPARMSNNLKQIMLAMHNYHDVHGHLPAAISRDEDGKPLLSWRVAILPYLEEQNLYDQFHLDEPWDSEHNIKLVEFMPRIYQHPAAKTEPDTTVYQVPVGEPFMFIPEGSTGFRDITDGLSNTIAAVETNAESAVPWSKPEDVEIDPENPLANMGDISPDGFYVGFGDGSVRLISDAIDIDRFLALLTRAGGEIIPQF